MLCEHIPSHKLAAVRDPSNPPYVKGLFYDKSMNESVYLDKACEEWEALLSAIIKAQVEPNRKDIESALGRLNASYQHRVFHPDADDDNSVRFQAQGIKMMISRIADRKRAFTAVIFRMRVIRHLYLYVYTSNYVQYFYTHVYTQSQESHSFRNDLLSTSKET